MTQSKYTVDEQFDLILLDLQVDIDTAERQAVNGPFYLEQGTTPESLRAYAGRLRATMARLVVDNTAQPDMFSASVHTMHIIDRYIRGEY